LAHDIQQWAGTAARRPQALNENTAPSGGSMTERERGHDRRCSADPASGADDGLHWQRPWHK
jgi:hypothetical protein